MKVATNTLHSALDAADEITLATSVIRDLLRLAIEASVGADNRASSAMRAAERYIDDVEKVAERLSSNAMQTGDAS